MPAISQGRELWPTPQWSVQQVRDWVAGEGHLEAAQKMAEDEIDGEALAMLSAEDIWKYGMPRGPAMKLAKHLQSHGDTAGEQHAQPTLDNHMGSSSGELAPSPSDPSAVNKEDSRQFLFATYIIRYKDLAKDLAPGYEFEKSTNIPQYALLGDQSTGKTTILSRLAGLPLGFTSSSVGTRRRFEYALINDPKCATPRIEVDFNQVEEQDLFNVLTLKNEVTGFDSTAVSVRIWSAHVMSLLIQDLPGMQANSDAPKRIALELLKDPNVIPVVVLDPKDLTSAHYIYQILAEAEPPRQREQLIAICNKVDEKILGSGEWSSPEGWSGQWNSVQEAGFKGTFFVGWPECSNRNMGDWSVKKQQLQDSYPKEEAMVKQWLQKIGDPFRHSARLVFGLARFRESLHEDQTARMNEFISSAGPQVKKALLHERELILELEKTQVQALIESFKQMLGGVCREGLTILQGNFDIHNFSSSKSTLREDFEWLTKNVHRFDELPYHGRYSKNANDLWLDLQKHPNLAWLLFLNVQGNDLPRLGKASLERTVSAIVTWCWHKLLELIMSDFSEEFDQNIRVKGHEDTGNKVIARFKKRVMTTLFHPLVDVMCTLVAHHTEVSLCAPFASSDGGQDFLPLLKKYEKQGLYGEFQSDLNRITRKAVAAMNQKLHDQLSTEEDDFAGIHGNSEISFALASNRAGCDITGHRDIQQRLSSNRQLQCLQLFKVSESTLKTAGAAGMRLSEQARLTWKDSVWGESAGWQQVTLNLVGHNLQLFFHVVGDCNEVDGHSKSGLYLNDQGYLTGAVKWDQRRERHGRVILRSPKFNSERIEQIDVHVRGEWSPPLKTTLEGKLGRLPNPTHCNAGQKDEYGLIAVMIRDDERDEWIYEKVFMFPSVTEQDCTFTFNLTSLTRRLITLDIVNSYWHPKTSSWIAVKQVVFHQKNLPEIQDGYDSASSTDDQMSRVPWGPPRVQANEDTEISAQLSPTDNASVQLRIAMGHHVHHLCERSKNAQAPTEVGLLPNFTLLQQHATHEMMSQLIQFNKLVRGHISTFVKGMQESLGINIDCSFHDRIGDYIDVEVKQRNKLLKRVKEREQILEMARTHWRENLSCDTDD